ncbi:MAG: metal-dependent hydrolase [Pseudomonadales bacterium]|nr:metal-dependent hydrolase [Pseudomonadales bacterium]
MTTTASSNIQTGQPAAQKVPLGATVNIPPRRLDFQFDEKTAKRYFYADDPFLSAFWITLSTLFPEGEDFFVQAVRHYRKDITDPTLKAQVAGFIGQEAMHSKEHEAWNELGQKFGYPTHRLDKSLGKLLGAVKKYTPKIFQLSATVSLEHYTAIIAEQLLRDESHRELADPETLKLWLWHALEENEHKTVAYDVYETVSGNYLLRAGTMIPVTVIFFAVIGVFQAQMLASDKQLFNIRNNWKGFKYLFGRKGLFAQLVPQYLDFFKPGFHPSQHDTEALLDEWREKLFGADGTLTAQYEQANQRKGKKTH